jgi:hypothetical protein
VDAGAHVDPVERERGGDALAERPRLTREQALGALHEDDRGAHPRDGLRHLDADGAAPEHEQPARDLAQAGRLAVGPDPVELAQPGHRRDDRLRAGGDDDVRRGVRAAFHLDHPRRRQRRFAAQQGDALAVEPAGRPGVVVRRDHEVAPRERRVDVEPPGDGLASAGRAAAIASPGRTSVLHGMQPQ